MKLADVVGNLPTTKFSNKQLIEIAKKVGEKLFAHHRSKLIWGGDATVEKTNSFLALKELIDNVGEDALNIDDFCVGDFEYVIYPSSASGVDASLDNLVIDQAKLADADGNIYLVDNTDSTLIRIFKPTIKTKTEYIVMVKRLLTDHDR